MAIKKEDSEEDLELNNELDEDDDDEDDSSGASESNEGSSSSEGEEGNEDGNDEGGSSEPSEEEKEREALREKRRREKKRKKDLQRRREFEKDQTILSLQETVKKVTEELKTIKGSHNQQEEEKLENEMNELASIYNQANAAMEKAIKDGDGAAFTKAKKISDQAFVRYNTLDGAKKNRSLKKEEKEEASPGTTQQKFSQSVVEHAKKFASKHKDWYKITNNGEAANLDSMIVQQLDKELYDDGYNPEDADYWEELENRAKERIPHRFKNTTQNKPSNGKPRVTTAGGGREASSGVNTEKQLPKEFISSLKAAGFWDDEKKKKAAINDYLKNKKKG